MNPFVPSKTQEGLLKQANALYTLASSQERRISMLNSSIDKLTRDYAAIGQDAIDAERYINQQLTDYVDRLEQENTRLKAIVKNLKAHAMDMGNDFEIPICIWGIAMDEAAALGV